MKQFIIATIVAITAFFSAHSGLANTQDKLQNEQKFQKIDRNLQAMIGQMLMFGMRGQSLTEDTEIRKMLAEGKVGGIILFYTHGNIVPYNLANREQIIKLTRSLQETSPYPLLIGVDQEGGKVQRLSEKNGFKNYPTAYSLGKTDKEEYTYQVADDIAVTLKECGFNLNFAPSVDLHNPNSPAIGGKERAFHETGLKTFHHAYAYAKAMRKNGIIPAIKHFPGHGNAIKDTHEGFTDITNTWQDKELFPYTEFIKKKYDGMIMVAHVYHQKLDTVPASLSYNCITKLLRQKMKFDGVVITDDMQMGAIVKHYSLKESIYRAIAAGNDILLFSNNFKYDPKLPEQVYNCVAELVSEGKISKERILTSWQRIRKLKLAYL
jgi:beta-N-acetylhexosaminidase